MTACVTAGCSSEELLRQLAYERSVAECAKSLLCRAQGGDAVKQALAHLVGVRHEFKAFFALATLEGRRQGWFRIEAAAGLESEDLPGLAEGLRFEVLKDLRTAMEEGRPFLGRLRETGIPEEGLLQGYGDAAVICLPLQVSTQGDGMLCLISTAAGTPWQPEDELLVRTTAELMEVHFERSRTSDEHEQKNRLSGALEMASMVCHKLNQPMQVILGYASMVTSGDIRDEKQIIEIVKLVEDETRKMGIITKNLMGITRMHDAAADPMIR